ncbi:MAG: ABC transporter ATP-binding protein, partial [Bacteroidota bacterium]
QKLINILESPKENELTLEAPSLKNSSLRFENIKFHYDDGVEPVFGNLNLEILPRTTTLLYGPSGCGKSTLIKLLLKSVSPENGQLKFGKIPYSELSEKTIRKHIAVVSNDYPLYGKDVYEAIVYSRNANRRSRASKLLQKLQQHENPKDQLQLHNRIGDLGCNLNAGQTKLLMYCRSLLTEKPILILEEPFECLSPKTSRLVLDILRNFRHKKTLIVLSQSEQHHLYFDKKHWLSSNFGSQSDLDLEISRLHQNPP